MSYSSQITFSNKFSHFVFGLCVIAGLTLAMSHYARSEAVETGQNDIETVLPAQRDDPVNSSTDSKECPNYMYDIGYQHRVAEVKDVALSLVRHKGPFNLDAVCDVMSYMINWKHIVEPSGKKHLPHPLTSFKHKRGSTAAYSTIVSSFIGAIGGNVRIVVKRISQGQYVAYPEVMLPRELSNAAAAQIIRRRYDLSRDYSPTIQQDRQGNRWLNLDSTAEWPGGPRRGNGKGFVLQFPEKYCYRL